MLLCVPGFVPCVLHVFCLFFIPESPRWLVSLFIVAYGFGLYGSIPIIIGFESWLQEIKRWLFRSLFLIP